MEKYLDLTGLTRTKQKMDASYIPASASVTIAVSDWSNNTCTKSVAGVTATNNVVVSYAPASKDAYTAADIYCSAQGAGTLTFTCGETPSESITVNVLIITGGN